MNSQYNIAVDDGMYFAFKGTFKAKGSLYRLDVYERVFSDWVYTTNIKTTWLVERKPIKIKPEVYDQLRTAALKIQKQEELQKVALKSLYMKYGF